MKTSWSLKCGALLLCFILCSGQNVTHSNDSQEAIKVKVLLQASASSTTTTTEKPKVSPTAKTFKQGQEIEEEEYNFLTDRLPELSEDEFNNLSEDANPLHFLKQLPMERDNHQPEVQVQPKPEVEADPKPQTTAPVISSQPSGSPIYITIPIYISTAGKLPLTLTIGDQELSLNKVRRNGNSALGRKPPSTKAPNSHYNRLLEPPKRRTTNRHRSQLKSHIYAIKDRQDSMFKPKQ
ncbi:uncharacterized protein Dana_GF24040 [Drosophila ananassae]|uniref:DUF4794 domain-containing protein n=1 Tax=Drosophila ananassae TaxID=7217 RepID=B3MAX8_DROAN|nr:uncharacterized protein Dana_GF24040 [Drosophila ananassae]